MSDGMLDALLADLEAEIERQDAKHGPFGGEIAIACLYDEVREALDAWREERNVPGMPHTREELIQVAAVAMRAVRDWFDEEDRDA